MLVTVMMGVVRVEALGKERFNEHQPQAGLGLAHSCQFSLPAWIPSQYTGNSCSTR